MPDTYLPRMAATARLAAQLKATCDLTGDGARELVVSRVGINESSVHVIDPINKTVLRAVPIPKLERTDAVSNGFGFSIGAFEGCTIAVGAPRAGVDCNGRVHLVDLRTMNSFEITPRVPAGPAKMIHGRCIGYEFGRKIQVLESGGQSALLVGARGAVTIYTGRNFGEQRLLPISPSGVHGIYGVFPVRGEQAVVTHEVRSTREKRHVRQLVFYRIVDMQEVYTVILPDTSSFFPGDLVASCSQQSCQFTFRDEGGRLVLGFQVPQEDSDTIAPTTILRVSGARVTSLLQSQSRSDVYLSFVDGNQDTCLTSLTNYQGGRSEHLLTNGTPVAMTSHSTKAGSELVSVLVVHGDDSDDRIVTLESNLIGDDRKRDGAARCRTL
jgi:hypothetical protein